MSSPALLDRLDSRAETADAIAQVRLDALEVGARRLALAAHWADLHPVEDLPVHVRGRRVGAVGTPEADEFAADELGTLLGIHTLAAQSLMADAVNLRHRHPLLWACVQAGEVIDWIAIKTARAVAAAGLDLEQARWVDHVTASYASTLTPGRYLGLVEAKIIEADPASAEARRQANALDRFVRTGQSTEHGHKTLVARATAGEIIYLVAVVDRIAQILSLQGDQDSADVRRSKALGILATPTRAIQLLAWAEDDTTQTPHHAEVVAALASVKPRKLLPNATLYLHLTPGSLVTGTGVARMEGVGPITIEQARDFLRHCNVTIKPVLDLAGGTPIDSYEIPRQMRETLTLRQPHEIFPWATGESRKTDRDHTRRYIPPDQGGPPGQTHPDKLGPLTRRHHRLKTHAPGWRHHQLSPGTYLWRTPTGHWTRVDNHGSHPIGKGELGQDISVMEQHFAGMLGTS